MIAPPEDQGAFMRPSGQASTKGRRRTGQATTRHARQGRIDSIVGDKEIRRAGNTSLGPHDPGGQPDVKIVRNVEEYAQSSRVFQYSSTLARQASNPASFETPLGKPIDSREDKLTMLVPELRAHRPDAGEAAPDAVICGLIRSANRPTA